MLGKVLAGQALSVNQKDEEILQKVAELGIDKNKVREVLSRVHRKTEKEMQGAYELLKETLHFFIQNSFSIFTQDDGSRLHPDSITDWLGKFSKKHNLPHIHPHAFRHPYVKHTTKNFSCKSRNPKPSNVMVWDFCFDYKFLDALVHLNSSS